MKDNIKFAITILIIIILIIIITMFIFINQKQGFHEDEMFSYGSSNYKYDNVYRQYGNMDEINELFVTKIFKESIFETIKNFKYYFIDNNEEKESLLTEIREKHTPTWKDNKEAHEYLSTQKQDVLNYPMVYYNQLRDVHPPLFYFLVHTVSILFYNNFSKYIIFIINLIFMIGTCYLIKKVLEVLGRKHLAIPSVLLYGLSIGAISTVMFQRMYMMLTFFTVAFILINLKIIKNNYEINKKKWIELGTITILGFLTQYYFCIIAVIIALIIFINIAKRKNKIQTKKYILNYIKIAVIGILLFPASIQHMFFSYRGVGSFSEQINYIEKLTQYMKLIEFSFSMPLIIGLILTNILIILGIYTLSKKQNKHISEILILTIPELIFILIIAKIAPNLGAYDILRYIMCILPIISTTFLLVLDSIIKNKKISTSILTISVIIISIYGLITSKPMFLYKEYKQYLQIAEENKENYFVYIGSAVFNQIQSMPEFSIYKASMILDETQIQTLEKDEKITNSEEFVLSIKKYLGNEKILEEILEKTGFTHYEILLDDNENIGCAIYKVTK